MSYRDILKDKIVNTLKQNTNFGENVYMEKDFFSGAIALPCIGIYLLQEVAINPLNDDSRKIEIVMEIILATGDNRLDELMEEVEAIMRSHPELNNRVKKIRLDRIDYRWAGKDINANHVKLNYHIYYEKTYTDTETIPPIPDKLYSSIIDYDEISQVCKRCPADRGP